jgi:arylsulfatase A-like enzyme
MTTMKPPTTLCRDLRWPLALLAACALPLVATAVPAAAPRPNIVVILSDDMGYADVPGFGADKEIPMPNLDRLARGGVRFTDAYVSAPICVPSRMGLMAGRHQARLGVYTNVYGGPSYNRFHQERLLPSFLKEAGYATAMFGKWHLSGNGNITAQAANDLPDAKGWDEIVIIPGGMDQFFAGTKLYHQGGKFEPAPEYLTDHFGKLAADFIHRKKTEPFLLYLAFNTVHAPLHAEDEDIAAFGPLTGYNRARYVPALKVGDRKPALDRQVYAGMMRAMDRNIGRVLDALDVAGVATNTLVFFLNDNGGPALDAATHSYNQACNAPYRGHKFDCLEGGIRTPLVARWPAKIPAGQTFTGLTSSLDILPTALSAAGVPVPTERPLDGVNLLPHLTGQQSGPPHQSLCWQSFFGDEIKTGQAAIRRGQWKLHQFAPVTTGPKPGAWALYDVAADPGESRDLAAQHPEVVRQLAAEWAAWKAAMLPDDRLFHWKENETKNPKP